VGKDKIAGRDWAFHTIPLPLAEDGLGESALHTALHCRLEPEYFRFLLLLAPTLNSFQRLRDHLETFRPGIVFTRLGVRGAVAPIRFAQRRRDGGSPDTSCSISRSLQSVCSRNGC
jgi:hypothetical protein